MKFKCFPRKILLGITGSIAAYKSAELIWLLKKLYVSTSPDIIISMKYEGYESITVTSYSLH